MQSTDDLSPRTNTIFLLSNTLACFFILVALAQLFTYELFPPLVAELSIPGGDLVVGLISALLVTLEVGALPYLLGMRLSLAMRFTSMISGWIAISLLVCLSLWENLTHNAVNSIVFGATIQLSVGWWITIILLAVGVVVGLVSWWKWPLYIRTEASSVDTQTHTL